MKSAEAELGILGLRYELDTGLISSSSGSAIAEWARGIWQWGSPLQQWL